MSDALTIIDDFRSLVSLTNPLISSHVRQVAGDLAQAPLEQLLDGHIDFVHDVDVSMSQQLR